MRENEPEWVVLKRFLDNPLDRADEVLRADDDAPSASSAGRTKMFSKHASRPSWRNIKLLNSIIDSRLTGGIGAIFFVKIAKVH